MSRPNYLQSILTKEALETAYNELGSLKAVGRYFNVDCGSVKRYMQSYGLDFKPQVRYQCDDDFFARDNEESFYIAGFIAADGCVKDRCSKNGNRIYEMQIGLAQKDKEHLIKLKNTIHATHPIHDFLIKSKNENWNDTSKSELTIVSKKMCEDLIRFNIVPRKSLIYTFPEWLVDHPLSHHFIRGYNDGDGSFYKSLGKDRSVEQIYFSMRGTPEFLKIVRSILERECNLKHREKEIRISSGHGTLEYGGNGIVASISNYLYQNATIYLDRKYEIIKNLIL